MERELKKIELDVAGLLIQRNKIDMKAAPFKANFFSCKRLFYLLFDMYEQVDTLNARKNALQQAIADKKKSSAKKVSDESNSSSSSSSSSDSNSDTEKTVAPVLKKAQAKSAEAAKPGFVCQACKQRDEVKTGLRLKVSGVVHHELCQQRTRTKGGGRKRKVVTPTS